jgi:hypothetical protein
LAASIEAGAVVGIFGRRSQVRVAIASGDLSLTASALRVAEREAQQIPRLVQAWQQEAFRFYYQIGEIHYAAQFYARALSQLRTYVGRIDEQGEIEEVKAGSAEAEVWNIVQDPGGGKSRLLGSYGRLIFLIGEGYLCCLKAEEGNEEQEGGVWEFLSPNELRINSDDTYTRYLAPGIDPVTYVGTGIKDDPVPENSGEMTVYRMWTPDPQYSAWADSSMKGVLEECDELQLLTLSVRARTKSRLSNAGVLLINQDLNFPQPTGQDDENPNKHPFQATLQQAFSTAIRDPGSALQVVPIVTAVPGDQIPENAPVQAMRHIRFDDGETYKERELRTELIKRIAQGLDMPPEMLTGLSDANHWTAWQVDEQTWNAHLKPVAQQMVDNFTAVYLRPMARSLGLPDPDSLVIGYDANAVISHPDQLNDALKLHAEGAISYAALRDAGGFNDADAQPQEEHDEWLAIKLRDPLLLDGDASEAPGDFPVEDGADVTPEPPSEQQFIEDNDNANANLNAALNGKTAYVLGAAQVALARSRELAGSRILSNLRGKSAERKCADCLERVAGVDSTLVACTLGPQDVSNLGLPAARQLVTGGSRTFLTAAVAFDLEELTARKLGQMIEDYAAQTLFDENPGSLAQRFSLYLEGVLS